MPTFTLVKNSLESVSEMERASFSRSRTSMLFFTSLTRTMSVSVMLKTKSLFLSGKRFCITSYAETSFEEITLMRNTTLLISELKCSSRALRLMSPGSTLSRIMFLTKLLRSYFSS